MKLLSTPILMLVLPVVVLVHLQTVSAFVVIRSSLSPSLPPSSSIRSSSTSARNNNKSSMILNTKLFSQQNENETKDASSSTTSTSTNNNKQAEATTKVGSKEYYSGFISRDVNEEPTERVTGDAVLLPTFKFVGLFAIFLTILTFGFLASNDLL